MPSQPICKLCGQPIWGSYMTALGATWHPEHFLCAACHKPIREASFNVHEGQPYHSDCYLQQVAPHCAYCGKPLIGEFLVDAWGTKFCKQHMNEYPSCSFCGRLIPPQQQEIGPNKSDSIRCPFCRASAIEAINQAQPIFTHLKLWMGSQGMTFNNIPLTLELCDRATLSVYMRERGEPHTLGVTRSTTHSVNGREVRTEVNGIAVLRGMPMTLFQGVAIHELGHAWLVMQGIKGLPSWAEEGFCELLAYRYYAQLNTPESRHYATGIEQNPSPTYGDGFRRIRAAADRMGFQRFVEELRTTKKIRA